MDDMIRQPSKSIYCKKDNEVVELTDFTIKKVIGRGAFGKVFIVEKISDGKIYAMKTIRKDIILETEKLESTLLEKEILKEADHPFMVGMEYVF